MVQTCSVKSLTLFWPSFTVGKCSLFAHEICFVKAFLQMMIYGAIFSAGVIKNESYSQLQTTNSSDQDSIANLKLSEKIMSCLWITVFSLATGIMTLSAYIGVKLVPVPDFVVLGHSSSFFTLILSAIFLKQKLTVLKMSLCCLVITGVIVVVQPTVIFGPPSQNVKNVTEILPAAAADEIAQTTAKNDMTLGTLVGLTCAFSAGLINVSSAKCKGLSRVQLMIAGGLGTYLTTIIAYFTLPLASGAQGPDFSLQQRIYLTVGVSIGSIIAGHLLVIANQVLIFLLSRKQNLQILIERPSYRGGSCQSHRNPSCSHDRPLTFWHQRNVSIAFGWSSHGSTWSLAHGSRRVLAALHRSVH